MSLVFNMVGGRGGIKLTGIAVTTPPTKTSYKHGEQFSSAGMTVRATYSNGATKMVTDFTCLPSRALKFTDEKITVVYAENGITRSSEQLISVGSPVVITDVRQLPYTYNLKGCGKHNNQYLMVGNDASWNIYGTIAPVSGQVNNYKMNVSGTYPAAGTLITDTRVDIPLTDKYGGTLYKNRYKIALTVADFLARKQGFQVTTDANVRMNCITEGGNGYIYTGGKGANGESCIAYVSKSAAINTNQTVRNFGSEGEIIDIASCKDSAGASHLAALTENSKILYKDLNTSGGLSGSLISQVSNVVKVGMLPDDTEMYRGVFVRAESSNDFYLYSINPVGQAKISYPAITSGDSTILGVGAINNYAIVVFADAAGNAKIYINEDWENGKTYSLGALTPLAMCKIPNGIGVICKTSTTNTLVIKEITLAA
jgi:hypothetical protein